MSKVLWINIQVSYWLWMYSYTHRVSFMFKEPETQHILFVFFLYYYLKHTTTITKGFVNKMHKYKFHKLKIFKRLSFLTPHKIVGLSLTFCLARPPEQETSMMQLLQARRFGIVKFKLWFPTIMCHSSLSKNDHLQYSSAWLIHWILFGVDGKLRNLLLRNECI